VEVWTDPDANVMYVVDGRGRVLNVREVNRRRAESGREPVKMLLVPFNGDEKEAVARIHVKNNYRRAILPSATAIGIRDLRAVGWSWEDCAKKLHVTVKHAEPWARRLLPLAFCVAEVRAAFDEGELPLGMAAKFGGKAIDGSEALGKKEQLELLEEKRASKQNGEPKARALSSKQRERVQHALSNGASQTLTFNDQMIALGVVAALSFAAGDGDALNDWPAVAKIARDAMTKSKKEEEEA
jgi:hypothetical protein